MLGVLEIDVGRKRIHADVRIPGGGDGLNGGSKVPVWRDVWVGGPAGEVRRARRRHDTGVKFPCVALAVAGASIGLAQHALPGIKLDEPPTIDGVIHPAEWEGASTGTGSFDENTGRPAPEPMQFWIAYDERYIYLSAKLGDRNPESIQAVETRTNVSFNGDDSFILAIDPFGTLSDLNQFQINPKGATNLKIAGGRAAKREWLGEIEAKGRVTPEGWECEARIPWAVMSLPSAGNRTLRFTVGRYLNRDQRVYIWNDISGGKTENIGRWTGVEVPRLDRGRSIKLLPYGYAGADRDDGAIFNAGLDFKSSITSDIELVGTINPDFRNVENQVLSLDFSHFERLAGESRPFFLEGQSYFSTSRDASIFASQRIGSFDAGAKAYGRLSPRTTFALLDTADFGNQNAVAANVAHSFDGRSSVTAAVSQLDGDGKTNTATFLGGQMGLGAFSGFVQGSTTDDTAVGRAGRFNTGVVFEQAGWNGVLEYTTIDSNFLPRLGFAPQRGYRGVKGNLGYVRPIERGRLMEVGFQLELEDLHAHGGGLYRRGGAANGSITLRDGTDFDFGFGHSEFEGFDDRYQFVSIERPRGNPYQRWQIDYLWGEFAGKRYRSLAPGLSLRPLRGFQIQVRYQHVVHFDTLEQLVVSANYELNKVDAVSGRLISTEGDTNFYLAYRRSGNRGNEYYLILGDPNARTFRPSVIFKLVAPLEIRF